MNNPQHAEAAYNALVQRGLGATGWSQGWKLNLWARVYDVDRTYQMVQLMLRENVSMNLLGLHDSRFQIDATFGFTAGIHEMIFQSHLGTIDLLPTFPGHVWTNGHIHGVRAIGGHTLDINWADGMLESTTITAFRTGPIGVRYARFNDVSVDVYVNGQMATVVDGVLTINAVAGQSYTIQFELPPFMLGDLNRDGRVTLADAALLALHVSDPIAHPLLVPEAYANITGIGPIGPEDVEMLLKYLAGQIPYLRAPEQD